MAALIDSSVLIAAERGAFDLGAWLTAHGNDELAISAVTWSELWFGWHRTTTSAQRAARESWLRAVESMFAVIAFDAAAAEVHADLWAKLEKRGTRIGAHDLLIAATALARGMSIVTLDAKDFTRIPGLDVLDPTSA